MPVTWTSYYGSTVWGADVAWTHDPETDTDVEMNVTLNLYGRLADMTAEVDGTNEFEIAKGSTFAENLDDSGACAELKP